jgi:carbon-monoxide dehydrogenase small subunit
MQQIINLTINGRPRKLAIDIRTSLADLLRYQVGLTSVKKGCEVGECGACTVLLDGHAVNSCIYLALWADGKSVLTVEGLSGPKGELNPVQQAFVDEAAVQCGFCTPGLILTAVELAGSGKSYSREDIRREISGHLCRCTGYENVLNAIEKALQTVDR